VIPITTFAGKKVAVFGLGGSGMVAASALSAGGADVVGWDDSPDRIADAARAGIAMKDLRELDWGRIAALVLAPGVPLTHPAPHWSVGLARAMAVEVIGDIELFCRQRRAHAPQAPFVAVTGTNGKSTTTALVAHVCREAGFDTQLGGNIGTAVLSLAPPKIGRVHVVECS
jgi:UDP-N-acetylmuramoylalanine--D-glutamate ligase